MSQPPKSVLLPSSPHSRADIRWRQIIWFIISTFAITWLIVLPLFFIKDPAAFQGLYTPVVVVMMFIPAFVAWLIVRKTRPKAHRARSLGFARHRPLPRLFGYLALAFLLPISVGLLSLPIASALGLYNADLTHFSGLREAFDEAGLSDMPIQTIFVTQIINVVLAACFLNLIPALGEETGWRGWLTPQLLPLGIVPTIIITGIIWGLWHTPVLLLGHNYPQLPGWQSVLFMVIFSTLIGGIFAWLAIRTNSVWPAALGHSTLNATGGLPLLFSADTTFDTAHVGITGTTGWLVAAVILLVLIGTRSFKPAPVPSVNPDTAWPSDYSELSNS